MVDQVVDMRGDDRVQRIASCYIGDVAANKKKSLIMPTLVVNLRSAENPQNHFPSASSSSSSSSSRAFRRRSHDVSPKDPTRREGSRTTLLFRPGADEPYCLEKWAREIQSRLTPGPPPGPPPVRTNTVDGVLREGFQENEYDAPTPSPSSLFLINGEPNTALLSPSIRSKTSNISSLDSDDRSSVISLASDSIGSPGTIDDRRPQSATSELVRPSLGSRHPSSRKGSTATDTTPPIKEYWPAEAEGSAPGRRETILDRYFSSGYACSYSEPSGDAPVSSMARFEALMNELEAGHGGEPIQLHLSAPRAMYSDRPRRIPSPTQRALEYVSTGRIRSSPSRRREDDDESVSEDRISPSYVTSPTAGGFQRSFERSDSDNDTLNTAISTTSTASGHNEPSTLVPAGRGKRHSLADFSLKRLSTPPIFGKTSSGSHRRGSCEDLTKLAEGGEPEDGFESGQEFGTKGATPLGVGRSLFREFSF